MSALLVAVFVASVAVLASVGLDGALQAAWIAAGRGRAVHPWAGLAPSLTWALPAAALTLALAALVPSRPWTWLSGRCACLAYGGLHICPLHLGQASGLVIALAVAACVVVAIRAGGVLAMVQRHRDLENLGRIGQGDDEDLVSVDHSGRPLAYVAGIVRPRLYVDGLWWSRLAPRERVVVGAHEGAHLQGNDPRTLAALDLVLSALAPRARGGVVSGWLVAAELRADAAAAKADGDPVYVAEVLCRYARSSGPRGALGLGGATLETRVRALLAGTEPPTSGWGPGFPAAVAGVALVGGHLAHRLFEFLLSTFS